MDARQLAENPCCLELEEAEYQRWLVVRQQKIGRENELLESRQPKPTPSASRTEILGRACSDYLRGHPDLD